MNLKNNKLFLIALPVVLVSLIALILVFKGDHDHDHDGHDHHHGHGHGEHEHAEGEEEFITFSQEQIEKNQIAIQEVNKGTLRHAIEVPGKVQVHFDLLTHIVPRVSGVVVEVHKSLGNDVQKGDLLVVLQSREVAESKSAYLASLKKEKLKRTIFEHEKELLNSNIASKNEYLEAEHAHEEAKIELDLNRQKLYALGMNSDDIKSIPNTQEFDLNRYEIHSPIAGKIIHRHATAGEYIKDEQEIFSIADLSQVLVDMSIYQNDLHYLKNGENITIKGPHGNVEAIISYLSPMVDESTHTARAMATILNKTGQWFPGEYVKGVILADPVEVGIAVPNGAIQKIDGMNSVFVATENGFEIRHVTIGRSDDQNSEILEGLQQGEKYAAANSFMLKAEHDKYEAEHEH